jgi:hypothetical protein
MGNWHSIYHEAFLMRLVSMAVIVSCWRQCVGCCSADSGWQRVSPGALDSTRDCDTGTYHDAQILAQTHRSFGIADKTPSEQRQAAAYKYVGSGG